MQMSKKTRKTFQQYLAESFERDPELEQIYEDTRVEITLDLAKRWLDIISQPATVEEVAVSFDPDDIPLAE
jgi:hypothetical protein